VSSVARLLSFVRRITLRRFARFVTDSISESALASLLTKYFCTSRSVCLTHRCDGFCNRTRFTRAVHRLLS
jgi:hypothetical protein